MSKQHETPKEEFSVIGKSAPMVEGTPKVAEAALDLIDVEYEILTAYLDPDTAMAATDNFIHDSRPGNIEKEYHHNFGDVEKGFAESDLVLEDNFFAPRITHAAMEPHSAVA